MNGDPTGYLAESDREDELGSLIETLGDTSDIHIFIHDLAPLGAVTELEATLPGFEKYPERALTFVRADDLVCVSSNVDDQYLEFLTSLGIGVKRENVIVASAKACGRPSTGLSDLLIGDYDALSNIRNQVKLKNRIVLNTYMGSAKETELAAALKEVLGREIDTTGGDPAIVNYINQKHNIRAQARDLGIPVPEGEVVELSVGKDRRPLDLEPVEIAIIRYIEVTGKVIIRGSCSFSGSSIFIVENNSNSIQKALNAIGERTDNRVYLVEVMLDPVVSPNILMYIGPNSGRILCVGVTDQCLKDDLTHKGNIFPSRASTIKDMLSSARKLAKSLQEQGYVGLMGFDFIECFNRKEGAFNHYLAEVNPRVNAAAYPKSLMEQINAKQKQRAAPSIEAFFSTNAESKASSFTELRKLCGRLLFDPEQGRGLVPYNIGCLERGKFTLAVFARLRSECMEMYEHFKMISAAACDPAGSGNDHG